MARPFYLLFGIFAYLIFFATFLYLIAFVGDLPGAQATVDRPVSNMSIGGALAINLALISAFGLQHSIMARQGFKAAWTRIVPKPIERSTYVLATSLVLILLFNLWQPLPAVIWDIENAIGVTLLWTLFMLGWLVVLVSTFLINHFELFGLAQVWGHLKGAAQRMPVLRQPFFYKLVRHPLYTGFFIAFWATPQMTVGHAVLALGMSAYMLIAIRYEERDLVGLFGKDYERYQGEVGMLTPRLRRRA